MSLISTLKVLSKYTLSPQAFSVLKHSQFPSILIFRAFSVSISFQAFSSQFLCILSFNVSQFLSTLSAYYSTPYSLEGKLV